jgi:FkbM family methyltransferase
MNHPEIHWLQKTTRTLLGHRKLRRYAWPLVRSIRDRYARQCPELELQASFDDNVKARLSLASHIEAQLFWQGFQEADEVTVQAMKDRLPGDGVFIDCGANIGSFTLVAARRAPRGAVHAFEPSALHLERLQRNIALNGFSNIRVNPVGLSDQAGSARLFLPSATGHLLNTGGATMFGVEGGSASTWVAEEIQLVRLDDYVRDQGLQRLDVVKIDVEGAEMNVLRGGIETIERFRPAVLMEIDLENLMRAGVTAHSVLAFWEQHHYHITRLGGSPDASRVRSAVDLRAHQNVLCLPDNAD